MAKKKVEKVTQDEINNMPEAVQEKEINNMSETVKDSGPGRDYFGVTRINKQKDGGLFVQYTTTYPINNTVIEEGIKKHRNEYLWRNFRKPLFL